MLPRDIIKDLPIQESTKIQLIHHYNDLTLQKYVTDGVFLTEQEILNSIPETIPVEDPIMELLNTINKNIGTINDNIGTVNKNVCVTAQYILKTKRDVNSVRRTQDDCCTIQ